MITVNLKLIVAFVFSLTLLTAQTSFFTEKTSQTLNDHVVHGLPNPLKGANAISNNENMLVATTDPLHDVRKVLINESDKSLLSGLDQFIVTVAGTGCPGYNGNILATNAEVNDIYGFRCDGRGDIYFFD